MSDYGDSITIRLGIHTEWSLGETPYFDGMIEDLATIDFNTAIMVDRHHIPFKDPDYSATPAAYIRISLVNNQMEWVSAAGAVTKTMAPYLGMVVGVYADSEYIVWVGDHWQYLFKFASPGASEISFDAGFPRAGRTLGMVIISEPCVLPTGQDRSRIIPQVAPPYFKDVVFTLKLNGNPIGTITIPYAGGPVTSPTFAIVEKHLVPGDRLSLVAPDNLMGLNGFAVTLRTYGTH